MSWDTTMIFSLQWRHNGRDGVSNHQPRFCGNIVAEDYTFKFYTPTIYISTSIHLIVKVIYQIGGSNTNQGPDSI